MSRQEFLKNVMKGPKGESSSQKNLDYWSARCSKNSIADDNVPTKPGTVEPRTAGQGDDLRRQGKADKNDVGSTFMPGVRRQT